MVHRVLAFPSASVVLFCGLALPPPAPITQVTARFGTGLFWASSTCTTNGVGSSAPATAL